MLIGLIFETQTFKTNLQMKIYVTTNFQPDKNQIMHIQDKQMKKQN